MIKCKISAATGIKVTADGDAQCLAIEACMLVLTLYKQLSSEDASVFKDTVSCLLLPDSFAWDVIEECEEDEDGEVT